MNLSTPYSKNFARIILPMSLGCFFILTVRMLQANLLEAFSTEIGQDTPDLVLIDIQ